MYVDQTIQTLRPDDDAIIIFFIRLYNNTDKTYSAVCLYTILKPDGYTF